MKGELLTVMHESGLDALFSPRAIAVIGASSDSGKVGGRTLELLAKFGFTGEVYPISRRGGEMFGWRAYPSIDAVDGPIDLAVLCVGEDSVLGTARECATAGVRAIVVYATLGGQDAQEQLEELKTIGREAGMRILGPNTLGSRGVVQDGVLATFSHDVEAGVTPGSAAIVAQSGGLGTYFGSSYLRRVGVGSRYVVDTGSEADINLAELVDYLSEDPEVTCIGAIVEGSSDGRAMVRAIAKAVARGVPVVVYKTGRTHASAAGIQSHTGAIAGDAQLFESAASDAGAVVAVDERDFIDALRLLDGGIIPQGRRLGIVTPSGGFGIVAVDAAVQEGLVVPPPASPPSPEEAEQLMSGDLVNPYDFTSRSGSKPDILTFAMRWMGRQDIDVMVIWQAHLLFLETYRRRLLDALAAMRAETDLPIIVCGIAPEGFDGELAKYGAVRMEEPTRMMRALGIVAPPAPTDDLSASPDAGAAPAPSATALPEVRQGDRARTELAFIRHVDTVTVTSGEEATEVAAERGWDEVILKVESDHAPHKTELGLVTGPLSHSEIEAGFAKIVLSRQAAGLTEPVSMQPRLHGVEIALGAFHDPMMGSSVLVALGGIYIEIFKDFAVAPAPVTRSKAYSMIGSLRSRGLLLGARGKEGADVGALADAIVRFSEYAASQDGWESIDLNPVFVGPEGSGLVAADALIVGSEGQS